MTTARQVASPSPNSRRFSSLIAALLLASNACAGAATVVLPGDGTWQGFDVSDVIGPGDGLGWIDLNGESLSFSVTIASGMVGRLTVVDTVFSGDVFSVTANGQALGTTSAAPVHSYPAFGPTDYDTALANPDYSRGVFSLNAGSYAITGRLFTSALDDGGLALNATSGGLKLTVSAVPEPGTVALLLAGLGLLPLLRRRLR